MAKRFSDNRKWDKPWFRFLTAAEKCAWFFITEKCDNVGVWDADTAAADFFIGETIDWKSFPAKCNGNVEVLENGKWFLTDFCDFQYGALSPDCLPHRTYIKLLEQHGLHDRVVYRVCSSPQDIDKDIDKEKEIRLLSSFPKEKDQFELFWTAYPRKVGKKDALKSWYKIKPDGETATKILAAVEAYGRSPQWTKNNGQFIPHPATFLNQERWNDEIHPVAANGKGVILPWEQKNKI